MRCKLRAYDLRITPAMAQYKVMTPLPPGLEYFDGVVELRACTKVNDPGGETWRKVCAIFTLRMLRKTLPQASGNPESRQLRRCII